MFRPFRTQVSDLMSNVVTSRLKSPLSDPFGREARVTSALKSPLSVPNGREASLTAVESPLSKPYGWEASVTAVKNPPSENLCLLTHSREVGVIAASVCNFKTINHNSKKKKYRLRGRSSETAKAHRG
eukprot:TRINITY_DN30_c0_g1_i10.p1 TRINITY_DN30_c0_g1~~TRINITY_DN30_c0_g1_i10.p1  ORF type:complete len:128 (-),score=28.18 TRINITY_DN30_c0_g1_i10:2-385(-)